MMGSPEVKVLLHSKFSPSTLPNLAECLGYLPGPSSSYAERGSNLDTPLSALISGQLISVPEEFRDEIDYGLEAYQKALESFPADPPPRTLVQYRVFTAIPEVHGTLDWAVVGARKAIVADNKSGYSDRRGKWLQLKAYACGLAEEFPALEEIDIWRVEVDRKFVEKTGPIPVRMLLDETYREITKIIDGTKDPNQKWSPNDSCKWCLRSVTCPALEEKIEKTSELALANMTPREYAVSLRGEDVGAFLTKWKARIELADKILGYVEERAMATLEAGGEIPGWQVGRGRARRAWADEAVAEKQLREAYGDKIYSLKMKTPNQIEEELKPPKPLLKALVTSVPSKKLVPIEGDADGV